MNHGLSEQTLAAMRRVLAATPQVEKAVLYGSRAKGNYRRGSDIDLTLFGDELNSHHLSQIDWDFDDLLLPYKIDLSLFSELRHAPLMEHICRVGIPIYERTPAAMPTSRTSPEAV